MAFGWEHAVWRRSSRFRIELPTHRPLLATLVKLIAKSRAFIDDLDLERLATILTPEPGLITHMPSVVMIIIRTKGKRHEEQLLQSLASVGYSCKRAGGRPNS